MTIQSRPLLNSYKIWKKSKIDLACFNQKYVKIDKKWLKSTKFNEKNLVIDMVRTASQDQIKKEV